MSLIIAVDIGLKGGICIMHKTFKTVDLIPMPIVGDEVDKKALFTILRNSLNVSHVCFEQLGVIFGTSKKTAFTMGHQLGALEAMCIALNLSYTKVHAKKWQAEIFAGIDEISKKSKAKSGKSRDTKAMAQISAQRLFPEVDLVIGDRSKKPHEGCTDSLLIAEYCRRHF